MIQYKIFHGESEPGLLKSGRKAVFEKISNAHEKAWIWIASTPGIEVISVSNGHADDGSTFGAYFVSVWYRTPG
jgi:hypothetical protein